MRRHTPAYALFGEARFIAEMNQAGRFKGGKPMNPHIANSRIAVKAKVFPYDYWHDRYQEYYQAGLALYLSFIGLKLQRTPPADFSTLLKLLRRMRDAGSLHHLLRDHSEIVMKHIDRLARYAGAGYRPASSLVGEYLFWPDSKRSITMCIDSHDSGTVTNPTLLETSDIYVKTNYWEDTCDPRVIPFFNCNPIVLPYISKLKAMRNQQSLYDFCFIVRVWGGKTGTDGVEHCIQLLEALAKVRAKKFLLAELVVGDTSEQARRLRSSGIPTTTRRLPLNDLWDIAATSRVNVFRLGNHQCLSWRMTDLFALGACIALDQEPKTQWPVPLVHNQHYCSLGATTSYDEPVATVDQYGAIPDRLEELLRDGQRHADMRRQTAEYFDQYLHPFRIGEQLYDMVMARYSIQTGAHACVPESDYAFALR
jgi:hypothetical protein